MNGSALAALTCSSLAAIIDPRRGADSSPNFGFQYRQIALSEYCLHLASCCADGTAQCTDWLHLFRTSDTWPSNVPFLDQTRLF